MLLYTNSINKQINVKMFQLIYFKRLDAINHLHMSEHVNKLTINCMNQFD